LIAAIFIDQGYSKAKEFVNKYFLSDLDDILGNVGEMKIEDNPIGYLQEYCEKKGIDKPIYDVSRVDGSDNSPTFLAEVKIDNERSAIGTGKSKPDARKDAARNVLKIYASF